MAFRQSCSTNQHGQTPTNHSALPPKCVQGVRIVLARTSGLNVACVGCMHIKCTHNSAPLATHQIGVGPRECEVDEVTILLKGVVDAQDHGPAIWRHHDFHLVLCPGPIRPGRDRPHYWLVPHGKELPLDVQIHKTEDNAPA